MKYTLASLCLLASISTAVFAQDATNAPGQTVKADAVKLGGKTDEERIQLLLDVAKVYYEEEEYESAVSAMERVLEIDPSHQQTRYSLSHYYISAEQYAKAVRLLNALIKEHPEDYQVKNNLAWLYATAKDPAFRDGKKSIRLAQEAMVEAPDDHHVWSTLAEAYYINGDYEKAYRAINQMRTLAIRYGKGITAEMVEEYNVQIKKCKRAWDTEKELNGEEAAEEKTASEDPSEEK